MRVEQAMQEVEFAQQREAIKAIEDDEEAKRNAELASLKAEKDDAMKKKKEEISKKFVLGPEDEAEL